MAEENNKVYVGNLPYSLDDQGLGNLFSEVPGVKIVEATVIRDKFNPTRSRGFGFVTFETAEQAQAAVEKVNGKDIEGRKLVVNVARPRVERGPADRER